MIYETRINPSYERQQKILKETADSLGVVLFKPNYHGAKNDKNTVLFYTVEDEEYNKNLELNGCYDTNAYKKPFWRFENTDANGMANYGFANFGRVDLRVNERNVLAGTLTLAYVEKKKFDYFFKTGGFEVPREADDTYNAFNIELLEAYRMIYPDAHIGRINHHGEQRVNLIEGKKSVYTKYTGQKVYNFDCDFVVPCADEELERLIIDWNVCADALVVKHIMSRIEKLNGKSITWF